MYIWITPVDLNLLDIKPSQVLTDTTLRQLATATSYSRGEGYFYDSSVGRIKGTGSIFTGKVSVMER